MGATSATPSRADLEVGAPLGARIGPNAILQVVAELRARFGDAVAGCALCATPWRLERLPTTMVDQRDVVALVHGTHRVIGAAASRVVFDAAGVRTARYLLAKRIPRIAQWCMRIAPAPLALRLLLSAIGHHSWTFAGDAEFVVRHGAPTILEFHHCAMCRGLHGSTAECSFYAGTFRELVHVLVARDARVEERDCEASGGDCCRFIVELAPRTVS
jgi:divinyl protochlorophyllide a 8-vinyl-reductase